MAHSNLGNILLQEKRPQEAIEHFQQVLRLQPENFEAYANLGIALAQTDRLPEAMENFRLALRQNPNDPATQRNLGNALMLTGRPNEAIEHVKQALRIKPDYTGAYYLMAMAYARINQTTEAIAAAQKALNLARSEKQTVLARQIEDWLNSYQGLRTEWRSAREGSIKLFFSRTGVLTVRRTGFLPFFVARQECPAS